MIDEKDLTIDIYSNSSQKVTVIVNHNTSGLIVKESGLSIYKTKKIAVNKINESIKECKNEESKKQR